MSDGARRMATGGVAATRAALASAPSQLYRSLGGGWSPDTAVETEGNAS